MDSVPGRVVLHLGGVIFCGNLSARSKGLPGTDWQLHQIVILRLQDIGLGVRGFLFRVVEVERTLAPNIEEPPIR